jgi:hypothetical protein
MATDSRKSQSGTSFASVGGPNLLAPVCRRKFCARWSDTPPVDGTEARSARLPNTRPGAAQGPAAYPSSAFPKAGWQY